MRTPNEQTWLDGIRALANAPGWNSADAEILFLLDQLDKAEGLVPAGSDMDRPSA